MVWFSMMFALANPTVRGASHPLPAAPGLLDRWDPDRSWGTPTLIDTLLTATEKVAWDHPFYDPITIGDLSARGGGGMFGHTTHDEGIDADLGLYVGRGTQRRSFADVTPEDLDPRANWAVIAALLETGNVQFILLDQGHIDRIRAHLLAEGWKPSALDAVFVPANTSLSSSARGVIRHAANHRSHLHVRATPPPEPARVD